MRESESHQVPGTCERWELQEQQSTAKHSKADVVALNRIAFSSPLSCQPSSYAPFAGTTRPIQYFTHPGWWPDCRCVILWYLIARRNLKYTKNYGQNIVAIDISLKERKACRNHLSRHHEDTICVKFRISTRDVVCVTSAICLCCRQSVEKRWGIDYRSVVRHKKKNTVNNISACGDVWFRNRRSRLGDEARPRFAADGVPRVSALSRWPSIS